MVSIVSQLGSKSVTTAKTETTAKPASQPSSAKKAESKTDTPSTVVSLNQAKNVDLGLFTKTGIVEKTASASKTTSTTTQAKQTQSTASKTSTSTSKTTITSTKAKEAEPAGAFVADGKNVVVDIRASDSGYNNKIFYSTDYFKTRHYIGIDNNVASVNLGSFAAGTKIEFGIENDRGEFFRTGQASSNSDGFDHAKVEKSAQGTTIGFEDLLGGGDKDFNDAIINVRSVASQTDSKTTSNGKTTSNTKTTTTVVTKDNRSGLGDNTNPGKGDGRVNTKNTGTNNPNKSIASGGKIT